MIWLVRGRVAKAPDYNRHGLDSKPTCAILLCPWERHFTAHLPAWWFSQVVLNFGHISTKTSIRGVQYLCISGNRSEQLLALCISASVAFLQVIRMNIENNSCSVNKKV